MLARFRRLTFVLAATLATCVSTAPVTAAQLTMISAASRETTAGKRNLFGGALFSSSRYGRKGAGVSMAQQQRTAAKKRGVAHNRRHHR